jgi:hypothetical protein
MSKSKEELEVEKLALEVEVLRLQNEREERAAKILEAERLAGIAARLRLAEALWPRYLRRRRSTFGDIIDTFLGRY